MITTDPAKDTPQALGSFLNHFDQSFIGLISSTNTLKNLWAEYGVTVLDNGETHTSYVYLVDPKGNLIATYPLLDNVDGITADLKQLLSGK